MIEHFERALSRRTFVGRAGSCLAHLSLMSSAAPPWVRGAWAGAATDASRAGRVVAQEPWGRLERIADGVWALISTPLTGDRTTLCNGGLVAGRNGVLMVEAFASDVGARWMAAVLCGARFRSK